MEKPKIISDLEDRLSSPDTFMTRKQAFKIGYYLSGNNMLAGLLSSLGKLQIKYSSEMITPEVKSENTQGIWKLTPTYHLYGKTFTGNPVIAKINDNAEKEFRSHLIYGKDLNEAAKPLGVFENAFLMTEAKGMPLSGFLELIDEVKGYDLAINDIKTSIDHARLAQLVRVKHTHSITNEPLEKVNIGKKLFTRINALHESLGIEKPDAAALAYATIVFDRFYQNQGLVPKADMSSNNTWINTGKLYRLLEISSMQELVSLAADKKKAGKVFKAIRKSVQHLDFDKLHISASPVDDINEIGLASGYHKWSRLQNLKSVYSMMSTIESKLGKIPDYAMDMLVRWDFGFQYPLSSGLRLSRKAISGRLGISFGDTEWFTADQYEGQDTFRNLGWLFHINRSDDKNQSIAFLAAESIQDCGRDMQYSQFSMLKKEIGLRSGKDALERDDPASALDRSLVYLQNVAESIADKFLGPFENYDLKFNSKEEFSRYINALEGRTLSRSRAIYEYAEIEKDYIALKRALEDPAIAGFKQDKGISGKINSLYNLFAYVFEDASNWAARMANERLEKRYLRMSHEAGSLHDCKDPSLQIIRPATQEEKAGFRFYLSSALGQLRAAAVSCLPHYIYNNI